MMFFIWSLEKIVLLIIMLVSMISILSITMRKKFINKKLRNKLWYKEIFILDNDAEYVFIYNFTKNKNMRFTIPRDKLKDNYAYASKIYYVSGHIDMIIEVVDKNGFQLFYAELTDVIDVEINK